MENNKLTAVEWLEDRLDNLLELYASEWDKVSNLINQAKAMEKEQIVKAFNEGTFSEMEKIDAEDYYNQTYGLFTEH